MKKLLAASFVLLVSASVLAGCNTVSGAGQDVQAGGRAVQEAAE
ncbi:MULTISPECIES: entericidin A/B family lipoprotein [Halomonadaceae]|uniref:Entericidin A/B family lipoprotein n=1 Tax=Vreelandella malpeensis TaxID=1172368 RepID=A0ABS8DP73_9GAMM|nr:MULTISPECIES: entericidin A/B family lipoprotein [Halomonas]MCB8888122.1 entericidin A/B family lipoprotein [Halomonas malpeensis]MCP1315844.1 entericidin A/B family lipoprotein [Halomonas sp. 707D7]MCP1325828.1 entericidin A/B family lipoprotein [Halomonas sp. 707D4]